MLCLDFTILTNGRTDMKVDSLSSSYQSMNDLLKVIAEKSIQTSDKLLRANIETRVKSPLPDTLGQNIDVYA